MRSSKRSDRAIDTIVSRYPSWVRPLEAPEYLGGAGGLSGARLWRYPSQGGLLVLRAWPPHGPGREHLSRVHRWLDLTADLGFIPVPVRDLEGRTLQEHDGGFFEITPWLAGTAERSHPPARDHLRSAFDALAAFHRRLASEGAEGTSPGLRHRHEAITRLDQGGFGVLETATERGAEARPERRDAARRWLMLARLCTPFYLESIRRASTRVVPLQPCLRDARPEHFLFVGDRLNGLVDFGAMGVDCVACDLARLMGEWLGGDSTARGEAMAVYARRRPLDDREFALIRAFECSSALLIGEHWIRWHYLEDRRFEDPEAVTSGILRGLEHLERLVGEADRDRIGD